MVGRGLKLPETSKPMIANCPIPGCNEPVPYDHPYSWCVRCGERFPETIRLQLTKQQEERLKAEVARAAVRSQTEEICARCGTHFMVSAKLDSLGFREFTCPNCHLQVITPLRWSYRITYWVFLCLWTSALIQEFPDGDLDLGVAAVCLWIYWLLQAILKDLKIVYYLRAHRQGPHRQGPS